MKTGITFVDMAGIDWFQELEEVVVAYAQVKLVICGHAQTTLVGKLTHATV